MAGLVINKAVAVYIGPAGLAVIGQFQNFSQLTMTAAQGAINRGVTKYTAEYGGDNQRIPILFNTAAKISIYSSLMVGTLIVLFSKYASLHFLKSEDYRYIFVIFGFTIILFVINNLLLSIINGLKEIKFWVTINIVQSIYSLIFTTLLIVFLGLDGALIALATNQSVIFLIMIWMLRTHPIINLENFKGAFDKTEAKKLGGFAVMAISSAATVPVSHLIVRNYIGNTLSWEDAGYWQSIWYISTVFLMISTSTLGVYFLPRLSEIHNKDELKKELFQGYKVILPIAVFASVVLFVLRDVVIQILFTKEFNPVRELFFYQLVGNVVKITSWLLGYIIIAKSMTRSYVLLEIISSFNFVAFSIFFINSYGLIGVTHAYLAASLVHLPLVFYTTRNAWGLARD